MDKKQHFDQTVFQRKERTGFSGGFKIPEEYRTRKENQRRVLGSTQDSDKDDTQKEHSLITKDEIMAHLNLGNNDGSIEAKNG
jgi:hypothetical protein